MKTKHLLLPLLLSAAGPVLAWPYTVRSVLTGMDNAVTTGTGGARFDQPPVAVDFAANGRRPWYAGGLLMTNAPFPGSLTLPFITLPQTPSATVKEMASAVCDVDGDGDMDVVRVNEWVGNAMLYTFQVFLNNGSGSFTAGYRFDWTDNPSWAEGQHFLQLCAGDFNSDGSPDIAVLETYNNRNTTPNPDRDEGRIFIRWNDGAAQFATTTTLKSTGLSREARLSAADCDRDGDLDLACTRDLEWPADDAAFYVGIYSSRLYRNNGAGGFSQSDLTNRPGAFADVNRDGWPDLVSSTEVALNNGSGSFAAPVTEVTGEVAAWTHADADGDGICDLIRAEGTSLVHYKGAGNGTFANSWSRLVTLPAGATAVGAGDSDGDGDMDFFVSLTDGNFAFVEDRAMHTLPESRIPWRAAVPGITALESADFNLDGIPDIAAVDPGNKVIQVFYGGATGIPGAPLLTLTGLDSAHSVVAADFDRDGRPDLAYTLPGSGRVRMARNNGDAPLSWLHTDMATGLSGVSQLTLGKLGTAGKFPDLLTSNATTGQLRWIYWNNTEWFYQVASTLSPAAGAILAAPVTSTGRGDEIVFMHSTASTRTLGARQLNPSWITLGSGNNTPITGGPHASSMVWADTTGDGKAEVVYVSGNGSLATWNPVSGTTGTLGSSATLGDIRSMVATDWDRDGRTDILCATTAGLELVYWNRISTTWEVTTLYTGTGGVHAVQVIDSDRDGRPDAVVASSTEVALVENDPALIQTGTTPGIVSVRMTGTPGQTVNALSFTSATAGRPASASVSADVDALFTGAMVRFSRANGSSLTQSELAALVTSVRFKAGGLTVGSAGPAAIDSAGNVQLPYNTVFGNLVSLSPGESVRIDVELELKSTAWQAGLTSFKVTLQTLKSVPNDGLALIVPGSGSDSLTDKTSTALVEILRPYTALDNWRGQYFGSPEANTGAAANSADPDGDGVPNLVEFITGTHPLLRDVTTNTARALTILPLPTMQTQVKLRLVLNTYAMTDPRVKVTIQWSDSLKTFSNSNSLTGGGSWSGDPPQAIPTDNGTTTTFVFDRGTDPSTDPQLFYRLKVEELP